MQSERIRRGLPETRLSLVFWETSTWVHIRAGRRVGGHWIPGSSVDFRLGAVDLDIALEQPFPTVRAVLARLLEESRLPDS